MRLKIDGAARKAKKESTGQYGKTCYADAIQIPASGSAKINCLNYLVLIISTNGGMYDLYSCIGYQSDANRSKITLLSGNGHNTIAYSEEYSNDSCEGIYTVTNGNIGNTATVYRLRLR